MPYKRHEHKRVGTLRVAVTAEDFRDDRPQHPTDCALARATTRALGFAVEVTEHEVYVRQPREGDDCSQFPRQRVVGSFTAADTVKLQQREPFHYDLTLLDERSGYTTVANKEAAKTTRKIQKHQNDRVRASVVLDPEAFASGHQITTLLQALNALDGIFGAIGVAAQGAEDEIVQQYDVTREQLEAVADTVLALECVVTIR